MKFLLTAVAALGIGGWCSAGAEVGPPVPEIGTSELAELIKTEPRLVLIDVRTPEEVLLRDGMIDATQSYNIPRGWLEFRIRETVLDPTTPIVVYCGRNERSPLAAATLREMGYTNVRNYAAGIFAWREAGLPRWIMDKALDTPLYERPRKIAEGVYSAIGATQPPSYENAGHNNNLSFVIGSEAVLVVNAGDNDALARALQAEIRQITDLPVRYVALENAQGHAMLGSGYWKDQGAQIIAHRDAATEIHEHGAAILARVRAGRRDYAFGTRVVEPDVTFDEVLPIELGNKRVELRYLGPAHGPGDIVVWLPEDRLVISGDVAFHVRLLPVFETTDTARWIETWDAFEALGAEIVIPGHGGPTNMAEVTRYTKDYLVYLRGKVRELLDNGGQLEDAYKIDQSPYRHLHTYNELSRQNAGRVFRAMEFE